MRKVVAGFNMTLDGFCDHTSSVADEEIHDHYSRLLNEGGTLLYGRITYQLMESYWPGLVKNPSGEKSMDDFAVAIDNIPKIVFSKTLKNVEGWKSAKLAKRGLKEEVLDLRQQPGKDILIGSRSLIVALLNLNLIDELQLCVQPILAAKGLPLFNNLDHRIDLKLIKTKLFKETGSVLFYYEPIRK